MYFTYILRSEKDGGFYYGSCSDTDQRLKDHNAGRVRSTKNRRPLHLHYTESFDTKREAIKREKHFKSIKGYLWLKKNKVI